MKLNGVELGAAASIMIAEYLKNPPAASPEKKKFIQECIKVQNQNNKSQKNG